MQAKQIRDYPNGLPEPRHLASDHAVKSERGLAHDELADLLGSLRIEPVRSREALIEEVKNFLSERLQNGRREVTDRTLWSYVRYYLTNYDEIRAAVKTKVGASELYENVKVYLCCRIIREYGLNVDPLYAAFGENGSYGRIPDRFTVENLEATATQLILQEMFKGSVGDRGRMHRSDASDARVTVRRGRELGKARPIKKRQINEQKQQEVSR